MRVEKSGNILSIVTCHPTSSELPILRSSVNGNLGGEGIEITVTVGASSIARAYNQGAEKSRGDILLFTHSDVEICSSRKLLEEAMAISANPAIGFLGIAGGRVLREDAIWWSQRDQLSGLCLHREGPRYWPTAFGMYGQVVVLDGVFLMCSRSTFDALSGFDESIPGWDFYDIDVTLRSYLLGKANVTFPILCLHHSLGNISNKPGWHMNRKMFLEKWGSKLPVVLDNRVISFPDKVEGEVQVGEAPANIPEKGTGAAEQRGGQPESV